MWSLWYHPITTRDIQNNVPIVNIKIHETHAIHSYIYMEPIDYYSEIEYNDCYYYSMLSLVTIVS